MKKLYEPCRSKLVAAEKNGLKVKFNWKDVVLYLGASHGYTPSYIAARTGFVFAVEISPYVIQALIEVSKKEGNIAPILADANKPLSYFKRVSGVDVVYQDIAQKNQVEIFLKNVNLFLKNGGIGLLAVKCRSIDVSANPSDVFETVKTALEKYLKIQDYKNLEPYEKDHYMIMCKKE
ncbi:fibrillarin-like rRNA/tRNA 2'-O-methyltransferase [Candidatus Woesearchaeota archaeon]|nr:fibrillarin-like rRNA/tRNA 2'-O-methyltransferase [Candidatus Woesearchaeota archaeon]